MTVVRLKAIEARLAERALDAVLVTNLVNLRWLTGFTGSSGAALVGPGVRRFFTDFRYLSQSATQVGDGYDRVIETDLLGAAAKALGELGEGARLGFDDADLSVKAFARLRELADDAVELKEAAGLVEGLRAVKDADEVRRIRAAADLADEALRTVLSRGLAGRTEREVALDIEVEQRRLGAEGASFPPIVAAGAHGALPHASPRDERIPNGTLVVIDWGAQLDGYCSDCTRTYATGGLSEEAMTVYDLVLRAQEAALDAVGPGPTGKEVDAVARELIAAGGHGDHFGHGLGHGVGLEVHEGPRLSVSGEERLAAGHVVTVEPGVYVPGEVGVRIEDLVLVTGEGHDVLNGLPKALTVVA